MTNKPMLSVERELRGAVEQALLAIKRIYQAGHDGIVSAGGSCDKPGAMFEGDPTVRELRALLDKPCCDHEFESPVLSSMPDYCAKCHADKPAAQHQGEPVYQVEYLLAGGGGWHDVTKDRYDASQNPCWRTRIVYAEQPAPVAVVMPERKCPSEYRDSSYTQTCMAGEYNRALDDVARLNGMKP